MKYLDTENDAKPQSYPKIFNPKIKALHILEMNAGFAEKNDIKIGDKANLKIF